MKWSAVLLAVCLLSGCGMLDNLPDLPDIPDIPVNPDNAYPTVDAPMRGLLFTPIGVVLKLKDWYLDTGELAQLRTKYNTLALVADLPCPVGQIRTYIGPGRSEVDVTDLLLDNLARITAAGFRVNVVLYNEPSVRLGLSTSMKGMGYGSYSPGKMYSTDRLIKERQLWANFRRKTEERGIPIYAATLVLEPSDGSAVVFQQQLASYIRNDLGWSDIRLFGNGMGAAFWHDNGLRVEGFPSLNSADTWCTSAYVPNGDGQMWMDAAQAQANMPWMSECRSEWQFYVPALAGYGFSPDQRPVVQEWMYEYVHD